MVAGATDKPWGVGVITWAASEEAVRLALSYRPAAVFLSFGDPAYAALVRQAGVRLICQVQDVAGARQAVAAGADVIVAQGTEAGGHGNRRSTLPLVRRSPSAPRRCPCSRRRDRRRAPGSRPP